MIWIPKIRQSATQARCSLCRSVQAKIDSCGASCGAATLADTFLSAAAFTAAPVPLASVRATHSSSACAASQLQLAAVGANDIAATAPIAAVIAAAVSTIATAYRVHEPRCDTRATAPGCQPR